MGPYDANERPDASDLVDDLDAALERFEREHGEDIWSYMDQAEEHASEAFAEHGMGAVSMGWNGTDAANAAVAEGNIYSTSRDANYALAARLAEQWRVRNTPVAAGSDVPADASDFAPRAGARPCPIEDDIPF